MSDERFARQYRYGPPPEFLLASSCTSIVRCFSGPIIYALAQKFHKIAGLCCRVKVVENPWHKITFVSPFEFLTLRLADMLDSLVRVTRRVRQTLVVNQPPRHQWGCDQHLHTKTRNLSFYPQETHRRMQNQPITSPPFYRWVDTQISLRHYLLNHGAQYISKVPTIKLFG